MELKNEELFREFYSSIKEEYNITQDHCTTIIKSPFKLLYQHITGESSEKFRLKYLGKFYMNPMRINHMIKKVNKDFEEGKITKERHTKLLKKLNKDEKEE
jgi:hypothetical protein